MVMEAGMAEEIAHPEAIVSTEWVAERLRDPSVVVAEIDSHLDEAYETGHVPGAVGWGLHTDMEHPLDDAIFPTWRSSRR